MSFRANLTISISALVLLTGAVLTIFSYRNSKRDTEILAGALFKEVTSHAVTQTRDHVLRVVPVAKSLAALGERGLVLDQPDILGAQLIELLLANPGVTWVSYSNEAGTFTGAYRTPKGDLNLNKSWIVENRTQMVEYRVGIDRKWRYVRELADSGYDPRKRPFYQAAKEAKKLVWLPPYIFYEQGVPGITCANPLYDSKGNLLGVLTFDFDLNALSELAADLSVSANSKVIILTPEGVLLAHPKRRLELQRGQRAEGKLPTVEDAGDPETKFYFEKLTSENQPSKPKEFRQFEFDVNGEKYFGGANWFQIEDGPVWIVGAIAPQSDFLGGIFKHNLTSLLISVAAVLAGMILAGILARRVSGPIVQLVSIMHGVGSGDLTRRAELGGTLEFRRLSDALNQMVIKLREGLRLRNSLAVAQEVQQKLLPPGPPTVKGLDIAGHTSFCDETGGDYLDYLILDRPDQGGALVAVGDVVGHGVAAALLMATVRGILRSRVRASGALGEIVTHLNDLLVADMRDGKFITLCLMIIDPNRNIVRWARAGHDPALLYCSVTDSFQELAGEGGPPLGIERDILFEEQHINTLKIGDVITLGTDGIWETRSPAGEFFGKPRLREVIRKHSGGSATEIAAGIQRALIEFRGEERQKDDVTFAVIKVIASAN